MIPTPIRPLTCAVVAAVLALLAGPRPAHALIDPDFTPINLYRNVGTIASLQVGPLGDEARLEPKVVETIKGEVPAGLAFEVAGIAEHVRADLEDQLGAEGAPGILLLSHIGYNAVDADVTNVAGAVLVGGQWFVLVRKDGALALDDDRLNLRNVWAGSALMLARCFAYLKADPAAGVPVASGMRWRGERKLGVVEGQVTGAQALDLFGDGRPCLLITARTGDRLFRPGPDGALTEVTAVAGLTGASRWATCGDFTGDGRLDLVTWDGARLLLAAQADGRTFATSPLPVTLAAGCLGLTTIDGGGRSAVLAAMTDGPVLVRWTDGAWHAAPLAGPPEAALGAGGACVAADLDGDGLTDVLQLFAKGIRVHRGALNGFAEPTGARLPLRPNLTSPMVGDFDADGLLDIVAVGKGGVVALRNLGGGRFVEQVAESGEVSYDHYNTCSAGATWDINSDGRQEFLLIFPAYYPQFFFNRGFFTTGVANDLLLGGDAGEGEAVKLTCAADLGEGQQACVAADFDGDGGEELVLVAANGAVWQLHAAGQAPRLALTVAPPVGATGPRVVTAWDGARCLGARLLRPGGTALFGKLNKGPLRLEWLDEAGRRATRTVPVTRTTRLVLGV